MKIACLAIWFNYFWSLIQTVLICLGRKRTLVSFLATFESVLSQKKARDNFFSILSLGFTSTVEFYFTGRMLSLVDKLCFFMITAISAVTQSPSIITEIYVNIFFSGFINLGTIGIWGWLILCVGDCPVHCGIFSSIPGLCPLDASNPSTHTLVTIKNVSRYRQMSQGEGGGQNRPQLRPMDTHTHTQTHTQ